MRIALAAALFLALLSPAQAADAARGKYLAILGDCAGCHTRPHGPDFAGGLPFQAQFGTVYSTNITPDRQTGIGGWSEEDFYRALHQGIGPGGRHLYPAFPYVYFARITRQDTADIFAYLKTLKPVHQPPTPNRLVFPANLRFGLTFWNWLYFRTPRPEIPVRASAAWKRGEYLVNGLGHCAGCHTPKDFLFGDIQSRPLAGGTVEHWFAANLTGGQAEGLGKWRHDDIVRFLATGRNRYATAAGTMQEKVTSSTSHMSDADRTAIATYLKSLAPIGRHDIQPAQPQQMAAGEAVFVANCMVCHAPPGQPDLAGANPLPDYPKLGGDTLVMGKDPSTVLRIILEGALSPVTPNAPTTYSMPSFATLSDRDIADVATYVRNSWGNGAPPVAPGTVRKLRAAIGG